MRPEGTMKPLEISYSTLLLAGVVLGLNFGGCVPKAKPDGAVIQAPIEPAQHEVPWQQRGKILKTPQFAGAQPKPRS